MELPLEFSFTPEQEHFRREVRDFLAKEMTPEVRKAADAADYGGLSKEFSKKVGAKGWIGLAWPKEYGGLGMGQMERLIYDEEMTVAHAPVDYHVNAERQMIPSIILFGTDEQKREYIPRAARGECGFGIGYSEPEAGSDLASLQTSAVRDGDDYVVNGQKVWCSQAAFQDYIWLAARTDSAVPRHRGISVLIVDLKLPGVTIQPIRDMAWSESFSTVFFDNVRVPVKQRVSDENKGWYVAANNLDFERSGIDRIYRYFPLFKDFVSYTKEKTTGNGSLWNRPSVRHAIADLAVQFEVGRLLCYRAAWMLSRNQMPNHEASLSKLFGTEVSKRLAGAAMSILGPYGLLREFTKSAPLRGMVSRAYLWAPAVTLAGGASEIQRNVIATRGLGLPRS